MSIESQSKEIQDELKKKYHFHIPIEMIKSKLNLLTNVHNFDEYSAKSTVIEQYENTLIKNKSLLNDQDKKQDSTVHNIDYKPQIIEYLHQMLGEERQFRPHQYGAIETIVRDRKKLLVIQRTGWGKSVVYFISTKILRTEGEGPTLIISPLLSLMRNQTIMAESLGLKAFTLNSGNRDEWDSIIESVKNDECDLLLISPERLSKEWFETNILNNMKSGPGLFVVDEAHCISDWGHDFRPDYKRIINIVKQLPPRTPLLATTATANKRVVDDIIAQLGRDLSVLRGPLIRENLRLMTIFLASKEERLAWLAENIQKLDHSGIVYCLTKDDCEYVSEFLNLCCINSKFYHADLKDSDRKELENGLLNNEFKVLVSTVALGMGFDKPDLGFVIHFQMPQSLLAYYQQVGRAGRGIGLAYAIMLYGDKDSSIINNLINNSFPRISHMKKIVDHLENATDGKSIKEISRLLNLREGDVSSCIKHLSVEDAVYEDNTKYGIRYFRSANVWIPDENHRNIIIAQKHLEKMEVKEYIDYTGCLMEFLCKRLDDDYDSKCGICANCSGKFISTIPDASLIEKARNYSLSKHTIIEPYKNWVPGIYIDGQNKIPHDLTNEQGLALCRYGDDIYGNIIQNGKYKYNHFPRELVVSVADMINNYFTPLPENMWVTCVPSRNRRDLMNSFASELASILKIPYESVIEKVSDTEPQKDQNTPRAQLLNIKDAFEVSNCMDGPVLLVDDMVDSGWTMTVCGYRLRKAGSGSVIPIALASSKSRRK